MPLEKWKHFNSITSVRHVGESMATEVILKKWGNSLGVILPKSLLKEKKLKEEDVIVIEIVKIPDLKKLFGSWKGEKMSSQELKNIAREGWSD